MVAAPPFVGMASGGAATSGASLYDLYVPPRVMIALRTACDVLWLVAVVLTILTLTGTIFWTQRG